jgi:BTB/POZ domain
MTQTTKKFQFQDADIMLVCSDGITFHVHKSTLAKNSPVFEDMLVVGSEPPDHSEGSLAQQNSKLSCGLQRVNLTETAEVLEQLLEFIYAGQDEEEKLGKCTTYIPPLEEYQRVSQIFEASCKYEVESAQAAAAETLR